MAAAAAASSFLLIAAVTLLSSPAALSLTCPNATYANCLDLRTLNASLQWTHNATALSVAFSAPAGRDEWVSWGLNPTSDGMVGAQALVAFRVPNGSIAVQTYNLSTLNRIVPSPISYRVRNMSGTVSGGRIAIFATLELPETAARDLNHVWQVGPVVNSLTVARHPMLPDNMNAKGTLRLAGGGATVSPAGSPSETPGATAASPGPGAGGQGGNVNGGGAKAWGSGLVLYGALVLLWSLYFGF